jgi:hypothetical protein
LDALQGLQQLSRVTNRNDVATALSGFTVAPPTETTQSDGSRRIDTAVVNPTLDPTIPLGDWKLRLVPSRGPSDVRIPISLVVESDGVTFRELRVTVARFELEADPNQLRAADLHTEPHTHLTPTRGNPPVRLIGPGLVLILRGPELTQLDVEVTGAPGGSDAAFPSARFEPPHFLIGDTDIGVVCDEVLVDLRSDDNPSVVDARLPGVGPEWTGIHLKELGVFIGDGTQVGTWSGMAAMRDFFIGFDAVDLTGTFIAELVHYVVDSPQV